MSETVKEKEVFRFMSIGEFQKLLTGETLKNDTQHKAATTSVGFCFMSREVIDPESAYDFLAGVVSSDVCVVFKTAKDLVKSSGLYADPDGFFSGMIVIDEYCTTEYNRDDFEIVRAAVPQFFDEEWAWNTDISRFVHDLNGRSQQEGKP